MASPFKYVSFSGVSLHCSTPELEEQVNRVLPLQGFKDFDGWNFAQAGTSLGPLPTPSLPRVPPLELGVLHWPNDATRPAWFHAAVTQEKLDEINDEYAGPAFPQNLVLKDGRSGKIVIANMSMLPPRPISQLGINSDGWLLTFTDQRFWWQWRSGSIDTAPTSWLQLFSSLEGLLGASISVETIDTAYGTPTDKWIGYLRPPATVLDAVAASVGQRIVVDLNGTVRSVNWETARTSANGQSEALIVAMGGAIPVSEIGKYVPAQVNVAGIDKTTTGPNGEIVPKTEEKVLADLSITEYGSAIGVDTATSTVFVDFDYTGSSDDAAFADLATAAAIDWYGWRLADLDVAFPGIAPWTMTGFEDLVEWLVKLTDPWIDQDNPHEPLILTRVRRAPFSVFPSTTYNAPGGSARSYIVKLTGFSTGIDGGVAWAGIIQHEVSGSVVDNGYIGADPESPTYVLYKTLADDGSPGVPEIGDIVIAVPDPDRPGVWEFIPKIVAGADCQDCCWFVDMETSACVTIKQLGGNGRCGGSNGVPADTGDGVAAVYVPDLQGWLRLGMGTTACGCGWTVFKPVLQEIPSGECTATVALQSYHISCASGSGGSGEAILDATMILSCCGRDEETGQPFAIFVGWGVGPCADTAKIGCDNTFRIRVMCADCPSPPCTCTECQNCCTGTSPFGYRSLFTLFTDQRKNGGWIWIADEGLDCVWRAICGEGSAAYTSTLEAIPQGGGDPTLWRLTHQDSVYESDSITDCCDTLLLTKVSGDGPATVELNPIKLDDECPPCEFTWPETLTFTVTDIILTGGAAINLTIGAEFPLTKLTPGPGIPWDTTVGWGYNYEDSDPALPSIRFRCVDQIASCRGFTLEGTDYGNPRLFSYCLGVGGTSVPCPDLPPDSVSTLIDCSCSPVYFEGSDYEKCVSGSCPFGPPDSTVTITGTVTE